MRDDSFVPTETENGADEREGAEWKPPRVALASMAVDYDRDEKDSQQ